jgi:uncharacterized membrane-anchored protein YhcB (DUF1043 family)
MPIVVPSQWPRWPLALLLLVVSGFVQADSLENLAEELVNLRMEVDELHAELDQLKEEHKSTMNSLGMQRSELEASLKREQVKVKQVRQELEENRSEAQAAGAADDELKPTVIEAVTRIRRHVQDSLPFKRNERLAELDDIERQVKNGNLTAHRAVNSLWTFLQDELRLTGENGKHRQSMDIEGRKVLTDVARIGMVMMYFQTEDDQYGMVTPVDGQWTNRILYDADQKRRTRELFESLQKQVRTGFFSIPNPYAVE